MSPMLGQACSPMWTRASTAVNKINKDTCPGNLETYILASTSIPILLCLWASFVIKGKMLIKGLIFNNGDF
jgi:predicted acylesterase/phospholipase RssA